MNYTKHYNLLIEKARRENRSKEDGRYYEKHHIVMRSEGGTDNKGNLVLLTAREHFVAHWLLHLEKPEKENRALAFQLTATINIMRGESKYTPSSRIVGYIKEEAARLKSKRMKGKPSTLHLHPNTLKSKRKKGEYIPSEEAIKKQVENKRKKYNEKYGDLLKMDAYGKEIGRYYHYTSVTEDEVIRNRLKTAARLGIYSEEAYWKFERRRWSKRPKGWKGSDDFWEYTTQQALLNR